MDTATVKVNGHDAGPIDQVDGGRRVEVGPYLVPGENTVVVTVASNLLSATGGGAQPYGLVGPVQLIPYGEALAFSTTDAPGTVGGTVPATLALSLGNEAAFGPFTPGAARDYLASTTANVISTAGDATLSVADPSSTATGHLVNGTFSLPQPLQARARNASTVNTRYGNVGSTANPLNLLGYTAPVSNDTVALEFKQSIGTTDALRTGTYAKTLTFTLSTTTP